MFAGRCVSPSSEVQTIWAGRKAAHPSKTAEESVLLVNVDVRIDHIGDHIGVMSHSTLKNIHSGRDSMRRKAEYDSTANTKLPNTLKTTNPQQQGFCFSFFCFSTAFLSSRTGVSMSVTFDTVGGSPVPRLHISHKFTHSVL